MATLVFVTLNGWHREGCEPASVARVIRRHIKQGHTLHAVKVGGTTRQVDARLDGDRLINAVRSWCKASPQLPGMEG